MSLFLSMLAIVAPIFLTIGIGQMSYRLRLISDTFIADANRLFYYVGLPLLLFHVIGKADFGAAFNGAQVTGAALAAVLLFLGALAFSGLVCRTPPERASFTQAAIRGNMSYIGLSVVFSAYGEPGLVASGVFLGCMVAVINIVSVLSLLVPLGRATGHGLVFWIRQLFGNPFILSALAGMAWSLAGLPMPRVLDETLGIVGRMTLPLALIAIGAEFKFTEFRAGLTAVWAAAGVKLVVMPCLAWALLWWLGVRGVELAAAVLLTASPTSGPSYIMAAQMGGDKIIARNAVLVATVCAVLTYAALLTALETLL